MKGCVASGTLRERIAKMSNVGITMESATLGQTCSIMVPFHTLITLEASGNCGMMGCVVPTRSALLITSSISAICGSLIGSIANGSSAVTAAGSDSGHAATRGGVAVCEPARAPTHCSASSSTSAGRRGAIERVASPACPSSLSRG
eukprot:scaffold37112_cov35-Tisochrysis_lutea.AAC.2